MVLVKKLRKSCFTWLLCSDDFSFSFLSNFYFSVILDAVLFQKFGVLLCLFFCVLYWFCHNLHIILNNSDAVSSSFSRFLTAPEKIIKCFWRNNINFCFTVILFYILIFSVFSEYLL